MAFVGGSHTRFDTAQPAALGLGVGTAVGVAVAAGVGNYLAVMAAHREKVRRCEQRGLFFAASEALRRRDHAARRDAERRADEAELATARLRAEVARLNAQRLRRE